MADFVSLNGYNVKDPNAGKALSISGNVLSLDKADGTSLDTVTLPGGEVEVITVTHSTIPITYGVGTVSAVSSTKAGATYTKGADLRTAFNDGAIIVFSDGTYKKRVTAITGTQFYCGTPTIYAYCSIADNANIIGSTIQWGDGNRIAYGDTNYNFPTANFTYDLINSNGGFSLNPANKIMIGDIITVHNSNYNNAPEASGIVTGYNSDNSGYSMITQKISDGSYCIVEFTIGNGGDMTVTAVNAIGGGGGGATPLDIVMSDLEQLVTMSVPVMPLNTVTVTDIQTAVTNGTPIRLVQKSNNDVIYYANLQSCTMVVPGSTDIAFFGAVFFYSNGGFVYYDRAFILSVDQNDGHITTVMATFAQGM